MTSQELTPRCVRGSSRVSGRGCGGLFSTARRPAMGFRTAALMRWRTAPVVSPSIVRSTPKELSCE